MSAERLTLEARYCPDNGTIVVAWRCPGVAQWHVRWFPDEDGDYLSVTDEDRTCAAFDTGEEAIGAALDYIEATR